MVAPCLTQRELLTTWLVQFEGWVQIARFDRFFAVCEFSLLLLSSVFVVG